MGDGQSTSDKTFSLTVDELFEDGCDSSDTTKLWPALLESEDQSEDDDGIWGDALTITLDVDGPSEVPSGLGTLVGSGKVRVSWDELDDDDVEGFVVIYREVGEITDTDAEGDAGADDEACGEGGGLVAGEAYDASLITDFEDAKIDDADATSATVTGLTNGVTYELAVLAVDGAANPSALSEVVCASPMVTLGIVDAYEDAGGAGAGEYCFIATAAFGSYDHPVVRLLRAFRDGFLVKLPGGRGLVAAYYAIGPTLAAALAGHDALRSAVAGALTVFAGLSVGLVALGPARLALLLALCFAWGLAVGLALPVRAPRRRP